MNGINKILFIIIFHVFIFKNSNSCENAKNGTFISIDKIAGKTIIQRNDTLQLEINETLGIKYLEKLKWISNCSYKIYDITVLENKKGMPLPSDNYTVFLEKENDSIYLQSVFIEKYNFTHKSKITKINNKVSNEFIKLIGDKQD